MLYLQSNSETEDTDGTGKGGGDGASWGGSTTGGGGGLGARLLRAGLLGAGLVRVVRAAGATRATGAAARGGGSAVTGLLLSVFLEFAQVVLGALGHVLNPLGWVVVGNAGADLLELLGVGQDVLRDSSDHDLGDGGVGERHVLVLGGKVLPIETLDTVQTLHILGKFGRNILSAGEVLFDLVVHLVALLDSGESGGREEEDGEVLDLHFDGIWSGGFEEDRSGSELGLECLGLVWYLRR